MRPARAHYSPEIFEDWWQAHPGNLRAIESVINHVHLWVFQPTDEDETNLEYKVIEQLAERMLICGRAAAAAQVPIARSRSSGRRSASASGSDR